MRTRSAMFKLKPRAVLDCCSESDLNLKQLFPSMSGMALMEDWMNEVRSIIATVELPDALDSLDAQEK